MPFQGSPSIIRASLFVLPSSADRLTRNQTPEVSDSAPLLKQVLVDSHRAYTAGSWTPHNSIRRPHHRSARSTLCRKSREIWARNDLTCLSVPNTCAAERASRASSPRERPSAATVVTNTPAGNRKLKRQLAVYPVRCRPPPAKSVRTLHGWPHSQAS